MMRIIFSKSNFEYFYGNSPDLMDEEISRTSIRMKLQNSPETAAERKNYQEELDRLTVLKYISLLRKGKLSREDFNLKVELT